MDSRPVMRVTCFRYFIFTASFLVMMGSIQAKGLAEHTRSNKTPTVDNVAIDTIDMDWWDDDKTLLLVDITFNFPISVTTDISDRVRKTHLLQLVTPGTVARNYKHIYRGTEHHAISKRFRDIIEEVRYVGGSDGKADLMVSTYEPTSLSYRLTNDFRTLHLEISRLQDSESK
jgi:hypothetical protein